MDFDKLRQQTLVSTLDEEAVTVNTRALIDKVLARYAGEHTTLRELIQNSADANATTVKVKYETLPSAEVPIANATSPSDLLQHTLLHHKLRRLVVSNDGDAFTEADWKRLKKIAEGNPDVEKIGAFGVGFYSVFADCENPFVMSGDQAMAFYWKENALFTRRSKLSATDATPNTSFILDYRNQTSPVPGLSSLCQFLATSLTFVALQGIELWLDDWKVLSLRKKMSLGAPITIPRTMDTKTKNGLMTVKSLEKQGIQMDADVMEIVTFKPPAPEKSGSSAETYNNLVADLSNVRSFFSRFSSSGRTAAKEKEERRIEELKKDMTVSTQSSVFLRAITATISTSVSQNFAAELERATKKPPPKSTRLSIMTSSFDERMATEATRTDGSFDVFASVHPTKKPGGRIFIGFPTFQTTGAGFHLFAPSLIPTVERESADLQARWVRDWNIELLRVAGIMTRLVFQSQMNDLGDEVKQIAGADGRTKIIKADTTGLEPKALSILDSFSLGESTPSAQVGQIIEEAFWTASRQPSIEIFSTRGVLPTSHARVDLENCSGFLDGVPVVSEKIAASNFVQKLIDFAILTKISVNDIEGEFKRKALTEGQLIKFLSWLASSIEKETVTPSETARLKNAAVVALGADAGTIISLRDVSYFRQPKSIPADLPIPSTVLEFKIVEHLSATSRAALMLYELPTDTWLQYLKTLVGGPTQTDMTKSSEFAAKVLAVLSKEVELFHFQSTNTKMEHIVELLRPLACVPTKNGLKRAEEAYLPSVTLFGDLPVVDNCPGVKHAFLTMIGVRKTVELDIVLERLLHSSTEPEKGTTKWSHVEVIKYLASVSNDIPYAEFERLMRTPICPAEAGPPEKPNSVASKDLYRVSNLYVPSEELRQLQLPILQWPVDPSRSEDWAFLSRLGLNRYVGTKMLIELMKSKDQVIRERAYLYVIHEKLSIGAHVGPGPQPRFLPIDGDEKKLVAQTECFSNPAAAVFGYSLLRADLRPYSRYFTVQENPPLSECVKKLIETPPRSRARAMQLYEYLSDRMSELGSLVDKLCTSTIVPVPDPENLSSKSSVKLLTPSQCFLGTNGLYKEIFQYVDFGQKGNTFLLRCGAKQEPSKFDVANMVASEPARLLSVLQTPQKYLDLLKLIAIESAHLKGSTGLWNQLRSAKCLLGVKEIPAPKDEKAPVKQDDDDWDDEETLIRQYVLAQAADIFIADDYSSYQIFRNAQVLFCPMDDSLESFYEALGARSLATNISKKLSIGNPTADQTVGRKLYKLLLERVKLFLHTCSRDTIKHDSRWLEENLSVQVVRTITLKRTIRGTQLSHSSTQTAAINRDVRRNYVLYVTGNVDFYEISEHVCHLLLNRPRTQEYMVLEMMLSKTLYELKDRGFNVDRILRAKAAQERIAEEERKKQLAIEQQRIKDEEKQWLAANEAGSSSKRPRSSEFLMPGAFGSPEQSTAQPQAIQEMPKRSRGLFDDIRQRIRNIQGHGEQEDSDPPLVFNHPPPSYDESERRLRANSSHSTHRPGEVERVTAPHVLHQNLTNAVSAARAHDSTSLFSPPQEATVKEQTSYCDAKPSQDISFLADASNGMRIYVSNDVPPEVCKTFISRNVVELNAFANLLQEVGDVFAMPRSALHIYYDETGSTIAFNSSASIFCNFRFFVQLHAKAMQAGASGRVDAAVYWWTTLCHELAHNLVADHSAGHSYFTESFVTQYFPGMAELAAKYTTQT